MSLAKIKGQVEGHQNLIIVVAALIIATIVVIFALVPPDTLAYVADAYTVAFIFLFLIMGAALCNKRKK